MIRLKLQQANLLQELVNHPGYALLKTMADTLDFEANERLLGRAFHEDLYYKACQRQGVQKLFKTVEQQLFILTSQLKQ